MIAHERKLKGMKSKLEKIGIIIKHRHREAADLALELATLLSSQKRTVYFCDESLALLKNRKPLGTKFVKVIEKKSLAKKVDFIIVLGG